ncbi:hypothetical protein Patl1_25440 [Pistacia atlantica]|uniref:Uncharacterized protein n=1 Tax=Pistacia atlantica TaxID=434234 RepID=A0ACC1B339_9ROSI|nr:hypothetical protein Patl1_25440 [Pistacia atlantica]
MKLSLREQPPPDFSNSASSSGQSRDDQETASAEMPISEDLPLRNNLNHAREVIAEMVGTFILMFCLTGNIANTQLMSGEVGLMESAATTGLTIIVVIFCIGPIPGAHVNPALTIALATFCGFPWAKVPLYILAQTVGFVFGAFIGKLVYGIKYDVMTTRPLQGCSSAFWVELLATFIIVFLVASLTYEAPSIGNISGIVVGIVVGLAVFITGPVSGGSMNPARSLGPAIISGNFKDIWIYITAPIIGAVSGGLLYRFLRLRHSNSSQNTNQFSHSLMFLGVRAQDEHV